MKFLSKPLKLSFMDLSYKPTKTDSLASWWKMCLVEKEKDSVYLWKSNAAGKKATDRDLYPKFVTARSQNLL